VDVALDSVGEKTWKSTVRSLARNGRLITYGATTGAEGCQDVRLVFWKQLQIIGSTMASHAEFVEVMGLVFNGSLEPVVDVVWPLERVGEAHERLEAGEAFGKIVLTP
jgi:NADPH:quinone reductase-like Zn-dependent oxidoreductase